MQNTGQLTHSGRVYGLGRTRRAPTSARGGLRASLVAEHRGRRHQHGQTTRGGNPHNCRTYLHPLPVDFHEEDAEGVGFGSDIPVQKVLATDRQLDFADAVLGANRPHRRGSHSVRHGLQQQKLQAVCGTQERRENSVQAENGLSAPVGWAQTEGPYPEPHALSYTQQVMRLSWL